MGQDGFDPPPGGRGGLWEPGVLLPSFVVLMFYDFVI